MRKNILAIIFVVTFLVACTVSYDDTEDKQAATYTDPVTGLMWEGAGSEDESYMDAAKNYCEGLVLENFGDWRLPTITELRTLIHGCASTATSGDCEVADPDCLGETCGDLCDYCNNKNGPGIDGYYWDPGADKAFWNEEDNDFVFLSSSEVSDGEDMVWLVDFATGEVYYDELNWYDQRHKTHCVRTTAPLAVGDKCSKGLSFCRDNTAYACKSGKLAIVEDCTKNDKACYYEGIDTTAICLDKPPVPVVALRYQNPLDGIKTHRVIKDNIAIMVSATCPMKENLDAATEKKCRDSLIVDAATAENTLTENSFVQQCCASDWKEKYCLKFRWATIETPTPYTAETRIQLKNIAGAEEGVWYTTCDGQDPTLAFFKAHMLTPTAEGKEYKVQIEAATVDRLTGVESDIVAKIDAPNIIPNARVMVQLTWKEGLQNRSQLDRQEGFRVDLDLHLIKKKGMDFCAVESGTDGLLCTAMETPLFPGAGTATHDDCHFNDVGDNGGYSWANCDSDFKTISWHAALDLGNMWGGGDYTSPETIDLGPIDDIDPKDGQPDVNPFTDDYLLLVNYNYCQNLEEGGSEADCVEGGANYNAHARIDIFVDGVRVPREGKDEATLTRKEFIIRPFEWVAVNLISWDQSKSGQWSGDAVVANAPATHQKVCQFLIEYCHNAPIWDWNAFETWVTSDPNVEPYTGGYGTCYTYGTRQ